MGFVRELIDQWSFADHSGPEPPLWVALAMCVPGIAGIALLPSPNPHVINAALVLLLPAAVIALWASWPFVVFKDNSRELLPLAVHGGVLAAVGQLSPPLAFVGFPIAVGMTPVLVRIYGVALDPLTTMIWMIRTRTRMDAWFAKPDDTALHLQPLRIELDDVSFRVVDTEREIVMPVDKVSGHRAKDFLEHRFIVFDPKLVVDKPADGYRGMPRERVEHGYALPVPKERESAFWMWIGDSLIGLLWLAVAHAILLGITWLAVAAISKFPLS